MGWTPWATIITVVLSSILLYPAIAKVTRRRQKPRPNGIEILSNPENATFEIVAVHGLGAHPEYTWMCKTPRSSDNKANRWWLRPLNNLIKAFWPRGGSEKVHLLKDFIIPDFPEARVVSFAYNSDWLVDAPVKTSQQIGDKLLKQLSAHRTNYINLPIIFIGHSFGGIVIKEMLSKPGDKSKQIAEHTRGIIFLGTPHQGSPTSVAGAIVAFVTGILGSSTALLLSLRNHQEQLSNLEDRFTECIGPKNDRGEKPRVISFYETKPTYLLRWFSIGLIVTRDSASGRAEEAIPIDTDHSGLNKCARREDELYMQLQSKIKSYSYLKPTPNANQVFVERNLSTVSDAAFDSYANQHEAVCCDDTRVDVLREVSKWATGNKSKSIFWLQGMAGTGKSTISYTVARKFAANGQLGASFFFKRGSGDRSNATRFFTTIAAQLVYHFPSLALHVRNAIEATSGIDGKSLSEQFEKLVLEPLKKAGSNVQHTSKNMVVVIDALDECDSDEESVKGIIYLLSQVNAFTSLRLRFFITSRPYLHIELGFTEIIDGYKDLILHEIEEKLIRDDISVFLQSQLKKIRDEFNKTVKAERRKLPDNWPSEERFQELINMAVPLFISASTACRFIEDKRITSGGPDDRLRYILDHPQTSDFNATYLPVLNYMVKGLDNSKRKDAIEMFKRVVGSIVILASPLSTISLARLLGISVGVVDNTLDLLHSVLNIPSDSNENNPVKLFHLSFRDFLVQGNNDEKREFFVDESDTHRKITSRCLDLLSKSNYLKKDILSLKMPGKPRKSIDKKTIDCYLPAQVQYACRYWIYHMKKGAAKIHDSDEAHQFLKHHFLHWLEAMSFIGRISETIGLIDDLESITDPVNGAEALNFIRDAKRFVLNCRSIIDIAPLQLYSSALVFVPKKSIIRETFQGHIDSWITLEPVMEHNWSHCLQTLEGHTEESNLVTFSSDATLIASGSKDGTIKIWDTATGSLLQTLEAAESFEESFSNRDRSNIFSYLSISSITFLPDSKLLKYGLSNGALKTWNIATGLVEHTFDGYIEPNSISSVAFSSNWELLALGLNNRGIEIWHIKTKLLQKTLIANSGPDTSVSFSSNSKELASWSMYKPVRIWNIATGLLLQTLDININSISFFSNSVFSVSFSHNSTLLALGCSDKTIQIWDIITGVFQQRLKGHNDSISFVKFSYNSEHLVSGSHDNVIKIWDISTGSLLQTFEGHSDSIRSLAFSYDLQLLASVSSDKTIKIWDIGLSKKIVKVSAIELLQPTLNGHSSYVHSVSFSYNLKFLVSGSYDGTIKIWDTATGLLQKSLKGHGDDHTVGSLAFSRDSKILASGSVDEKINIWDMATGSFRQTLKTQSGPVTSLAFLCDSRHVVSGSEDMVEIFDLATGFNQRAERIQSQPKPGLRIYASSVALSRDLRLLASGLNNGFIEIWDRETMSHLVLENQSTLVCSLAFSSNSKLLASGSEDGTMKIWDTATGSLQQTLSISTAKCNLSFEAISLHLNTTTRYVERSVRVDSKERLVGATARYKTDDDAETGADHPQSSFEPQHSYLNEAEVPQFSGCCMSSDRSWIMWNGNNVLWLPPNYRPCSDAVISSVMPSSTSNSITVAIGCSSGRVIMIGISGSGPLSL